jgi:hypothetical protein
MPETNKSEDFSSFYQLMTRQRWSDPAVRAKVYSRLVDAFSPRGTTQSNDNADIRKPKPDNRPNR